MNVVLFIYKRFELTQEIYSILEKVKPDRLFIFADGPKNESEIDKCYKTRGIFKNISWECELEQIYQESNKGLGKSIIDGLDYVFSKVEDAIILEDDCIPNMFFFTFCTQMLKYYKDTQGIMHINGTNLISNSPELLNYQEDFFFSKIALPWGWATWERAWNQFDKSFSTFNQKTNEILNEVSNKNRGDFDSFFKLSNGFIDAWDTQWLKDILCNNGIVITPTKNLITCKGGDINSSYMPKYSSVLSLKKHEKQKTKIKFNKDIKIESSKNQLCEDSLLDIMREFKFINENKDKDFKHTKAIVEFLQPLKMDETELTLSQIKEKILNNTPKYTALTATFYDRAIEIIPKFEKISRGNWVEVGVWKGGGALFLKSLMDELNIKSDLYLYDTSSEFPIHNINHIKDKNFLSNMGLDKQNYKNTYLLEVKELFEKFNLNENIFYKVSDVNYLIKSDIPNEISLLFIDVDFYEPTLKTLELFYDSVISNSVILIDDYYMEYLNCKNAVDDFFNAKGINFENHIIRLSEFTVLFIKP